MKKYTITMLTAAFFGAPAAIAEIGPVYTFSNDRDCRVQVSALGDQVVLNAAKQVNGQTEQVQVTFRVDPSKSTLSKAYCPEEDQESYVKDRVSIVRCLDGSAEFRTDLYRKGEGFDVSSVTFEGGHWYLLSYVDDSFQCNDLELIGVN